VRRYVGNLKHSQRIAMVKNLPLDFVGMHMKSNKTILLISSIIVFPFTLVVFRMATTMLGPKWGYLFGFGIYWAYALTIIWILTTTKKRYLRSILRTNSKIKYRLFFNATALLPVVVIFFISFLPNVGYLSLQTGILVLIAAILNGLIEEIYWRGLYLKEYGNSLLIGLILSTLLFTIWHFSLWYAKGIEYQGGLLALVGGAFMMGMLWSFISRKLKNIKICIIAHIMVNIFAFTGLFVQNSF
jgi:membrane protease YdiL (CAAX protease family)